MGRSRDRRVLHWWELEIPYQQNRNIAELSGDLKNIGKKAIIKVQDFMIGGGTRLSINIKDQDP